MATTSETTRTSMSVRFRRARHRRRTRWLMDATAAFVLATITFGAFEGAQRERSRWGDTTVVLVASHDLSPGATIGPDDVTVESRPVAVVPAGPSTVAISRIVTQPIVAGEVVVDRRLAAGDARGVGAVAPAGALSFAVPTDHSTPPLAVGDRVDAFAPTSSASGAASKAPTASRIARGATVVAVADRTVTIAVDPAQAPALARALLDTAVVLALTH